jgi:predicted nucleic acid-binding protein
MIVVDTNIICYRCMASPHAHAADAVWKRDSQWIAPTLWRPEFRNALAGALRHNSLTLEAALEIADLAETIMTGNEFVVSDLAVLQLVANSRCSAYDCEFIALAKEQQTILVTEDRELRREFSAIAMSMDEFLRAR